MRFVSILNKENNGVRTAFVNCVDPDYLLVDFYPNHIKKEDKVFSPASRAYFTEQEDQAMLDEFWEFDKKMIHVKYKSVVEALEQN